MVRYFVVAFLFGINVIIDDAMAKGNHRKYKLN